MFNMVEITENILSFIFVYFFFSFFPPPTSPILSFPFLLAMQLHTFVFFPDLDVYSVQLYCFVVQLYRGA